MFKFSRKAGKQAKRNTRNKAAPKPVTLQWRKSWNWGFLLVPVLTRMGKDDPELVEEEQ